MRAMICRCMERLIFKCLMIVGEDVSRETSSPLSINVKQGMQLYDVFVDCLYRCSGGLLWVKSIRLRRLQRRLEQVESESSEFRDRMLLPRLKESCT